VGKGSEGRGGKGVGEEGWEMGGKGVGGEGWLENRLIRKGDQLEMWRIASQTKISQPSSLVENKLFRVKETVHGEKSGGKKPDGICRLV